MPRPSTQPRSIGRLRPPMRVLHVADFAAPYPGAFIRQLQMLDEQLRSRGDHPLAFAFPEHAADRPWLAQLRADGCEVYLLPAATSRRERHVSRRVDVLLHELAPDVVHTHFGTYDLSVTAAVRAARRRSAGAGPRLVWHYRTALEEPVADRSPARRAKDWLKYGRAGRHVDLAVGVTQALADEVAARGMGDTARAIVAGCDTERFRADADARRRVRASLGIGDDELLLLHLGWHWHRKGGDLLAAAVRELGRRGVQGIVARSVGAPDDEVEAPVQALAPTPDIHELHQASDIFISASRSEGFGNGLVEGMACERVAVAAMVEGQREVFDGLAGCIAVTPGDAIALADGIEQLLARRDDWGPLGAANRARIVERHSMRRWARDMADAYAALPAARADLPAITDATEPRGTRALSA